MKCPRCNFENIPGRTRCFKCDSILTTSEKITRINPPRMASWKKPFRLVARAIRKQRFVPEVDFGLLWESHPEIGKILALLLDVVPGLGHLIVGGFKKIWWILLTWLVLIVLGISFVPSSWGFIFVGFAIGIHTWILLRHNIIKNLKSFRERVVIAIVFVILLFVLYRTLPRIVLPNLTSAYTNLTISENNIEPQDYFLARRNYDKSSLKRGSLVVIDPYTLGRGETGNVVGQIVALPGEKVELKKGTFVINGKQLDEKKYPVPRWLRNRKISFIINQKCYFVTSNYNVTERGRHLDMADINRACIYEASDIEAKVFMRWFPLNKRTFLE